MNDAELSTRPYLIRAIHEWCLDQGLTPHLAVLADDAVQVPRQYVQDGQIVLNISAGATQGLSLGNEYVEFQARFGGVPHDIMVPIDHVLAIYARENGHGMAFAMAGQDEALEVDEDAEGDEGESGELAPTIHLVPRGDDAALEDDGPSDPPPAAPGGARGKLRRIK